MAPDENNHIDKYLDGCVQSQNFCGILAVIARGIINLVDTQQELVKLAKEDMEVMITEQVENRAVEIAAQTVEESTKRSYIGKRT